MGGLFSSEEPRHVPQPNINSRWEPQVPRPSTTYRSPDSRIYTESSNISFSRSDYDRINARVNEVTRNFAALSVNETRQLRSIPGPERSKKNPRLFNLYGLEVVTYIDLEPDDSEYRIIMGMITNKKNFKVDSIQKIVNPYLEKSYKLKKSQKELQYGYVEERLLFHGTKRANVQKICTMNFDWRLCQTHKFGKGISFSPNANYASNYSDEFVYSKVMIVAKVLIGMSCIGNASMVLPPSGFDTTQKGQDGIVIVKFEDNEFLPVYKINYHLRNENPRRRYGKSKQKATSLSPQSVSPQSAYWDTSYEYDDDDYLYYD